MVKQTRQSRYRRPPQEKLSRIELQPKDVEIIKTVYEYRFIRTDQLTAILPGDRTSLEKRLRKLWEHRYLERSFLPLIYGKTPATRRAIYSIDYRGANILTKHAKVDPLHLKHAVRHNKPEFSYVEHQLMATQFRVVLDQALRKTNSARILFWRQDKEIRDHVKITDTKGKEKSYPIAPDGFFALEDDRGKMYWFLEVDRYTMDHGRWLEKMNAYYHWWEERKHTEKFGIKNFRVIAVCPNAKQRDARLEITKKVKMYESGKGREATGIRLFWFVSEEDYNLNKPENVLAGIFKVAKKDMENNHKVLE